MIDTFALDPEVLLATDNPIGIADQFGVSKGRLMAKLPNDWQHKILHRAKEQMGGTLAYKRLGVALKRITKATIPYDHMPFESVKWLEDAERNDWTLRCIVSTSNPRGHAKVITAVDMNSESDLWHMPNSQTVPRTAEAISKVVSPLVMNAKQLVLVDPHFDADPDTGKERFRNVLKNIVQHIDPKYAVTLHVRHNRSVNYRDDCHKHLPGILPKGLVLSIMRWRERPGGEKLHARYIMNQLGGMAFEVGLDEGHDGQTTDVSLLDDEHYCLRWEHYQGAHPAFDLVDSIQVKGAI